MKYLLVILLLLPCTLFGQKQGQERIDSLLSALPNSKEDTSRASIFIDLSNNYSSYSADSGILFGKRAVSLSEQLKWKPGIAHGNYFLGFNYYNKSNYPFALQHLFAALSLYESMQNENGIANATRKIGHVYRDQKKYQKALDCYFKALKIFEYRNDKLGIAQCYSNIGYIYSYQENYDEALSYNLRALQTDEEINYKNGIVITSLRIGEIYSYRKNYLLGLKYTLDGLSTALNYYDKHVIAKEQVHEAYGGVGAVYLLIARDAQLQHTRDTAARKAIFYLTRGIALAREMGELTDIQIYSQNLAEAEELTGNYPAALASYKQYAQIKDSLFSIENNNRIINIENQRELDLRESKIRILEEEKKVKSLELQKEKIIQRAMIGVTSLMLILAVAITMYYVRKQRHDRQITNEKTNTLLKEQELKSVSHMLDAQEAERKRIASDLHDRLGSMLSTVKLYFGSVEEQLDGVKGYDPEQYNKANALLDEACDEVRKISHDLVSGELIKFGLVPALRQLAQTVQDVGKIQVEVTASGMDNRLESTTEIALYRVIQELMNNILKHAQATAVNIQISRAAHELTVIVEDNGRGFEVADAKVKGGMGLRNMETRIHKLGGKIHFDSGRGNGTTAVVDIPIKNNLS